MTGAVTNITEHERIPVPMFGMPEVFFNENYTDSIFVLV
jgi:hypothetical protein